MYTRTSFGSFYPVDSAVHRLNPIAKLINFMICLILMCFSNDLYLTLFIFGLVVIMMLLSFVPLKFYMKTIWSLRYIYLIILFLSLYFNYSLIFSLIIILKIISLVEYLNILVFTTSPSETVYAIEKTLYPFNIFFLPLSKIALKINNFIRYIPLMLSIESKVLKAQASRGLDYYHSNFVGRLYAVINIWKNNLILTKRKSDEIYFNSELRLYNSKKKRTNIKTNKVCFYDMVFSLYHLLLLLVYLKIKNVITFDFIL